MVGSRDLPFGRTETDAHFLLVIAIPDLTTAAESFAWVEQVQYSATRSIFYIGVSKLVRLHPVHFNSLGFFSISRPTKKFLV